MTTARSSLGDYEALPEPIKLVYTYEEWMWLSDQEKTSLVSRETSTEEGRYED
jgi:hypothetical protein